MSRLWIFDFDGTLVDSAPAIRYCYEKVTGLMAPKRLYIAEKILIGPTLKETTEMILGKNLLHLTNDFMNQFVSEYDNKIILETKPYENINDLLRELRGRGDFIAIATNKRSYPTNKLIKCYKWEKQFLWVACLDKFPSASNKAEMVQDVIKAGGKHSSIFFIGDTKNDAVAAKYNNIPFIKANYGYGKDENWNDFEIYKSIDNAKDILDIK